MTAFSTHVTLLPMSALTARQTQILKALIDEYIETTQAVGSLALEKKYNLGVSPATIRSEMLSLTKAGYLRQTHTSAGRVPTPQAMKFYIDQLMEEKQMSLTEEVKTKEQVRSAKNDFGKIMTEATEALAESTGSLAVSALDDGSIWRSGFAHVFESPDFLDFKVCQSLFEILEEEKKMHELFFERLTGLSMIEVLFGEELGWPNFGPVGVVASRFSLGDKNGAIGVIGPIGLNYPSVIPVVRHFKNLIESAFV